MKVLFRSNQVWIGFWNNSKIFKWQRGPHDNFSLLAPLPTSVARRPPLPVLGRCQPLAPLPQFALSPSVVRNRPLPPRPSLLFVWTHTTSECRPPHQPSYVRFTAREPFALHRILIEMPHFPLHRWESSLLGYSPIRATPHPPNWQNMPQSPDTAATEEHCRPDLFPPPRRRHIVRMRSHPTS
jgi:hypothetical protein